MTFQMVSQEHILRPFQATCLCLETGWKPRFCSFFDGISAKSCYVSAVKYVTGTCCFDQIQLRI